MLACEAANLKWPATKFDLGQPHQSICISLSAGHFIVGQSHIRCRHRIIVFAVHVASNATLHNLLQEQEHDWSLQSQFSVIGLAANDILPAVCMAYILGIANSSCA